MGFPKRAIVSVWDKSGVADFAAELHRHGYQILSTSKTAEIIRSTGVPVEEVSEYTGSPEILGGRVKTLHPRIAGGILTTRKDTTVDPIDIVVCNLYQFEEGLARGAGYRELIELIDIGGVTLLRAAAKNHDWVTVVPGPEYYPIVVEQLNRAGEVSPGVRRMLAGRAFQLTSQYDAAIAEYFRSIPE